MKKILVTGAHGQLGKKISDLLGEKYDLILTDRESLDITDKLKVHKVLKVKSPDIIIHAAAYTQVDKAEKDKVLARKINATGTKNIAAAAVKYNIPLIYISTDYVFNGNRGKPYKEADRTHPLSVYGQTKLDGEAHIAKICKKYYIIRSSWIFGELPRGYQGSNFVETILRLAKDKKTLTIVDDQVGSPTYTKDLVKVMEKFITKKSKYGIYHFSGRGEASWFDFAKEIIRIKCKETRVLPIKTQEYPQAAQRPAYSYLDKTKIEKALDFKARSWKAMLKEYLEK